MSELVRTNRHAEPRKLASFRRVFVAMAAIVGGFAAVHVVDPHAMYEPNSMRRLALVGFGAAIVGAPLLARVRSVAAQIFSRAILLQLVCFGALAFLQNTVVRESASHATTATILMLTGLEPLLILGRAGFGQRSKHFEPSAFRRTLVGSLIFGLADAWALAFYAVMIESNGLLVASAAAMAIALFGLFRMKVWGLVLCIGANVAIAALALTGALDLPQVLAFGLATTAGIQLLLPMPLVTRIIRTVATR